MGQWGDLAGCSCPGCPLSSSWSHQSRSATLSLLLPPSTNPSNLQLFPGFATHLSLVRRDNRKQSSNKQSTARRNSFCKNLPFVISNLNQQSEAQCNTRGTASTRRQKHGSCNPLEPQLPFTCD